MIPPRANKMSNPTVVSRFEELPLSNLIGAPLQEGFDALERVKT